MRIVNASSCRSRKITVQYFRAASVFGLTFSLWFVLAGCGTARLNSTVLQQPVVQPDVYVTGVETVGTLRKAVYWKNGAITHLDSGPYGAWATGIALANGHVYVSGFADDAGSYQAAVLWTDGLESMLTPTTPGAIGTASAVAVSGGDIYVAGSFTDTSQTPVQETAEYWRNGSSVVLSSSQANALAIAVSDSDVYVLGTMVGPVPANGGAYSPVPIVWKNGVATSLIGNAAYATPTALTVTGGHAYVAGSYCTSFAAGCGIAAYWQDGMLVPVLSAPMSQASGIAVEEGTPYVAVNVSVAGGNLPEVVSAGKATPLASDGAASTYGMAAFGTDVYIV